MPGMTPQLCIYVTLLNTKGATTGGMRAVEVRKPPPSFSSSSRVFSKASAVSTAHSESASQRHSSAYNAFRGARLSPAPVYCPLGAWFRRDPVLELNLTLGSGRLWQLSSRSCSCSTPVPVRVLELWQLSSYEEMMCENLSTVCLGS